MNHRDPTDAGAVIVVVVVALLLAMCTVSVWQSGHRDQRTQKGPLVSNSQIIPGGFPIPALALVAVDNKSIFGSGSGEDPLRASAGGGGTYKATFVTLGPDAIPGMAVVGSVAAPNPGTIASVTPANASGAGATAQSAQVLGLIASLNADGSVNVQSTGPLTLTAAQWFAAGAAVDGLSPTQPYYATTAGHIDDVAPTTPGTYEAQVGVAIDALTLQLSLPALPIAVATNQREAVKAAGAWATGSAVYPSANGTVSRSKADAAGTAICAGLALSFPDGTHTIYQYRDIVTLPAATWDTLTGDVGGLVAGKQYFVSAATAGNITKTAPVAAGSFQGQIGLALSATELQLQLSAPIGPHA